MTTLGDRGSKALESVNPGYATCAGCGERFAPSRRNQRHCRQSCRVRACQQRQTAAQPALNDLDADAAPSERMARPPWLLGFE